MNKEGDTNTSFKGIIKNNISNILLVLAVVLIGVFFYIMNVLYPIYLDDWFYSFTFSGSKRISSFWEIFQSQYEHYFQWGGRSVVHTIAQILLWVGNPWADILNTLAYILLIWLMYSISNKGNNPNPILFLLVNIFLWFMLPSLSQNLLWLTGSANYLWGCLIVFVIIYSYISYYFDQNKKENTAKNICITIAGIIAGWTNENVAFALIFFLIGILILLKIQRISIPRWMIFGLVGVLIGFIIMMMSPGNFLRNKSELQAVHKITEITPSFYFYRFITILKFSSVYIFYPVLIYIISSVLYWKIGKSDRKKPVFLLSLLFFLSSIVATLVMAGSPVFPERVWFGIIVLMIVAIMLLLSNMNYTPVIMKVVSCAVFIVMFIFYISSGIMSVSDLERFRETYDRREHMIDEEISLGSKDVVIFDDLYEEKTDLKIIDIRDWLIYERDDWAIRYGRYKGVSTIKIYDSEDNDRL